MALKRTAYKYNERTLSYEEDVRSRIRFWLDIALIVVVVIGSIVGYYFFYTRVLDVELPKTAALRQKNARYRARYEEMNRRLDVAQNRLDYLRQRDNDTYRLLFGMEDSPAEVTVAQSDSLHNRDGIYYQMLKMRLDAMLVNSSNQGKSFEEIVLVAEQSDDLQAHVPSVPPFYPEKRNYVITSRFGNRIHPILKRRIPHSGVDFAMKPDNPIFSVGDGVIEMVKHSTTGYGTFVLINHGFGYKTRYAHLKSVVVNPGQKVVRGEQIGFSGNSGSSTGPHLHFEVIYRNNFVEPLRYMDLDMDLEAYKRMEILKTKDDITGPPSAVSAKNRAAAGNAKGKKKK